MKPKKFRLTADQITPLLEGYGACIATDRITVDGQPVGYCYREEPDNDVDSGWRFLAGDETENYLDEPGNSGVYNVNTIANYDRAVLAVVDAPAGTAFERSEDGRLLPV